MGLPGRDKRTGTGCAENVPRPGRGWTGRGDGVLTTGVDLG